MKEVHEQKMYPHSRILYKTDNTPGWRMATMGVEEDVAKKYCEEQKNKGVWTDYKCYLSGRSIFRGWPEFANCSADANTIHLTTDLIYNSYENKWYYPDEIMPIPKTNAKLCRDFYLDIKPDNDFLWDKDDFEGVVAIIRFRPSKGEYAVCVEDLNVPIFLKKLKACGYAELTVEEHTFCKLLAWKTEENILFILQDYGGDDVEEELNILVPEQEFYAEFIKLDENIKYLSARLATLYAEFRATELFLHNMRWVYDVNNPKHPQEYTLIAWNNDTPFKWKKFVKKIKKECLSDKTLNFGKYEYWVDEKGERISRTYAYNHEEDLIRFVKSSDFKYREGMTLRDVYQQLVSKGYQSCLEGEWKGREFFVYASGDVIIKSNGSHVTELEELVRKIVREANKKPTLSAMQLWELLRKAEFEGRISSGFSNRNMKIRDL